MKVYFTADPHIAHEKIINLCWRTFKTIQEHNDALIKNINDLVDSSDRLYILGDFRHDKREEIKVWRDKINCKDVRLVIGNHDPLSPTAYRAIFQEVGDLLEYKFGTNRQDIIVLSHYCMLTWNHSFRGSYHLYGHTHSKIEPWLDHYMPQRRSMDCGVDNALRLFGEYRPFSLDEILSLLKDRKGNSPDRLCCRVTKCEIDYKHSNWHTIHTDFNWSHEEAIDNCNNFVLQVEQPNGDISYLKSSDIHLSYFYSGCWIFEMSGSIPVGSILTWVKS